MTLSALEREYRTNRRELRRLQLKVSAGLGRNASATLNALDRRLARDRELLFKLAEKEG